MSVGLQQRNIELLDHASQLQRAHTRQDLALKLALRSPREVLGTDEFVARLRDAGNKSTLPSRNARTQYATVPEVQSSLQTSTVGSLPSSRGTRASGRAPSTSGTRSSSYGEEFDHERPTVRRRPVNGVPTALFRDDERRALSPQNETSPANQDEPQLIIVDRNDGAGVQEEFRRPRGDRHRR
jgi:hypothetical protein